MKVGDLVTNISDDPDIKYWGIGIIVEYAKDPRPSALAISASQTSGWFRVYWALLSSSEWVLGQRLVVLGAPRTMYKVVNENEL